MYLAHSAKDDIAAQTYENHIEGVLKRCETSLKRCEKYIDPAAFAALRYVVLKAAEFHDLGKLCDYSQKVIRHEQRGKMPNHVEAGTQVADSKVPLDKIVAIVIDAHHRGLKDYGTSLRDTGIVRERCYGFRTNERQCDYTDRILPLLLERHYSCVRTSKPEPPVCDPSLISADFVRLALSFLVSADHADTATNYKNCIPEQTAGLKPLERLELLKGHVAELQADPNPRMDLRNAVFEECLSREVQPFNYCSAVVGSGKTLAVLAFALKANPVKVIYVAPYISIIAQTVQTFRELILEGEKPELIVGEHHHQVETNRRSPEDSEESPEERMNEQLFATTWNTPIVCTTAVQFIESLASNHPKRLKKYHNLIGSHIILDESHLIPANLWSIVLRHLQFLVEKLGCKVTFTSGSMVRPWEHPKIRDKFTHQPQAILSPDLSEFGYRSERDRVQIKYSRRKHSLKSLCKLIRRFSGPKLVVMNLTKSAALLAWRLRSLGVDVLHLSTALCPKDREEVLEEVQRRLKDSPDRDWVLVGTSCIEAGVDLCFQHGFREANGQLSVIQTSGRINRHLKRQGSTLNVFCLKTGVGADFGQLAEFITPAREFDHLYKKYRYVGAEHSQAYFEAILRTGIPPLSADGISISVETLLECEGKKHLKKVAEAVRVISANQITVLVYNTPELQPHEVVRNSVEMYENEKWPMVYRNGIWVWTGGYDKFLGYYRNFFREEFDNDCKRS